MTVGLQEEINRNNRTWEMKYAMLKDLAPEIQVEGCVYEFKCKLAC